MKLIKFVPYRVMMLLTEDFVIGSKRVARTWLFLFVIEITIGFIFTIIAGASSPTSNMWLLEFLSWIRGVPNSNGMDPFILAKIWFPIYFLVNVVNFACAYFLIRGTYRMHLGSNAEKICRLRRYLVGICIFSIATVFALMVHGSIWWFSVAVLITCKLLYIRDVRKVDRREIGKNVELISQSFRRSLEGASEDISL